MAEENKQEQSVVPSGYNLDAKWDACLDLGVRRFTYFSLIGGFAGLLLFRECFPPPPPINLHFIACFYGMFQMCTCFA